MLKTLTSLLLLPLLAVSVNLNVGKKSAKQTYQGRFYDSTEKLDFSDTSVQDINTYYGDIGEKSGNDLLTYLYTKISCPTEELTKYYLPYGSGLKGVGLWYQLTDRNWSISSPVTEDTFKFVENAKSKEASGIYFYNMYISDEANNDKNKAYSNLVNSYTLAKDTTSIDYTNYTTPNSLIQMDKEHVWAKNHGFKVKGKNGDTFVPGAPTDLHHLVAADHNTNSAGHNDHYYGVVSNHSKDTEVYNFLADGTQEVSGWLDKNTDTFEPTDEWKGDVARCLFYMATRYSVKKDKNTQAEPYLMLTDEPFSKNEDDDSNRNDEDKIFHGIGHNLSELLEWNEKDPVSDYEIHRNNLIYNNVQNNRNPYIDHPEWARRVFDASYSFINDIHKNDKPTQYGEKRGSSGNSTEEAIKNLSFSYNLHAYNSIDTKTNLKSEEIKSITFSDPTVAAVNENSIKALKSGTTDITFTFQDETSKTISLTVKDPLKLIYKNNDRKDNIELTSNESLTLNVELENNFQNETIEVTSSDPNAVSVDGLTLNASILPGSSTILIKCNDEILDSFTVNVSLSKTVIIIGIAIIAVAVFLLILIIVLNAKNKKKRNKKRTTYESSRSYSSPVSARKSASSSAKKTNGTKKSSGKKTSSKK